tara:strand:- start:276 stop:1088 length:813 start_codon:yes stop_codon:yes gene_type:complete
MKKAEDINKTLSRKDYKRIHSIACGEWKPKLQDWYGNKFAINDEVNIKDSEYILMRKACTDEQNVLFDEIFGKDKKQLQVGKWYKHKSHKMLINIANIEKEKAYGFDTRGRWTNLSDGWGFTDVIEATEKEVESALLKEAEKRGFIEGVTVKSVNSTSHIFILKDFWHIDSDGAIWFNGRKQNGTIYKNGKWAEIVKVEKTYKRGQRFEVSGETYILARVGDKNHRRLNLVNLSDGNLHSESVKVSDTKKVTEREMELLSNYYKFTLYKE